MNRLKGNQGDISREILLVRLHYSCICCVNCSITLLGFRYIKEDMQKKFPKFDEIHLEFIRCPELWCEHNWTPDFFRETLPGFITSGILSDKGESLLTIMQ
jgi:hypothetical protein